MTATGTQGRGRTALRSRRDAVWLAGALAVLLLAAWVASDQRVPGWERSAFSAVNARSVLPYAAVWPLMQLGNVVVVLLGAVAAAATRRFRLAAGVVAGGVLAYLLAKVVKEVVERARPAELLDEVVVRGPAQTGEGFVSGHTTVAAVVVAVLLPHVGRRVARVLVLLAVLVAVARVYVGAHLPLDLVGGGALAVAVAAGVHLVLGRPVRGP